MEPGPREQRIPEAASTFLAVVVNVTAFFLWDFVPPGLTFLNKLLTPQGRGEHGRGNPRPGDRVHGTCHSEPGTALRSPGSVEASGLPHLPSFPSDWQAWISSPPVWPHPF